MRRTLSMLAIAAVVSLSLARVASGGGDKVHQCAGAKLKAAGRKAAAKLKCHARAEATGATVDSDCLTRAETKFAAAFAKAESGGGCRTPGDAGMTENAVDDFVAKLAIALSASTTSTTSSTSTTYSTCTTTSTWPPCQLYGGSFCGGVCPGGQTCDPDGSGGCACMGPPPPCCAAGGQFCSAGVCPPGLTCQSVYDFCGVSASCECR